MPRGRSRASASQLATWRVPLLAWGCRTVMANLVIAKMNKSLTKVFSSVKSGNCTWAALDAVDDVFPIPQAALANPLGQSRDGLFVAMLIVQNEKSGHSRPLHEKMAARPSVRSAEESNLPPRRYRR